MNENFGTPLHLVSFVFWSFLTQKSKGKLNRPYFFFKNWHAEWYSAYHSCHNCTNAISAQFAFFRLLYFITAMASGGVVLSQPNQKGGMTSVSGGVPMNPIAQQPSAYAGPAVPPGLEYLATQNLVHVHQILHAVEGTVC